MSVLPLTMTAPSASICAQQIDGAGRVRAVERVVAGNRDQVGLVGANRLADGLEGDGVAVDVRTATATRALIAGPLRRG